MGAGGVAHLDAAAGEVLRPAPIHRRGGLGVAKQLFRVRRFHPRVDGDRGGEGGVVAHPIAPTILNPDTNQNLAMVDTVAGTADTATSYPTLRD